MEEETEKPVYRFFGTGKSPSKNKPEPESSGEPGYKFYGSSQDTQKKISPTEKKNEEPSWLPAILGGGAGAYAVYTGANKRFFSPAPDLFAPSAAPNVPAEPQGGLPSGEESEVNKIVQSERPSGPTGRQMEGGHNWRSQFEAAKLRSYNLPNDSSNPLVEAGPMAPTKGGVAVPHHVLVEVEQENQAAANIQKAASDAQQNSQNLKMQQEAYKRAAQEKLAGKVAGAGKVGIGALGAAMSTASLYDAIKDMSDKGFSVRNIIQALSGAGGLAMTRAPSVPTTIIGTAMQIPEMAYQSSRIENPERDPRSGLDL